MLHAQELKTLRREAASVLVDVQALPGFAERRADLPAIPALCGEWPWRAVLRVDHNLDPGVVSWEVRPLADVQRDDPDWATFAQERGRTYAEGGQEVTRAPLAAQKPPENAIPDIASYVDKVAAFAKDCVFGAEWSARAVHQAIRDQRPIELPSARPLPDLAPGHPTRVSVDLDFGDPVPATLVAHLEDFLASLETSSHGTELDEERRALHTRARAVIEREADRSPRHHQHREALDALDQLRSPTTSSASKWLAAKGRDAMWEAACHRVAAQLEGRKATANERQAYSRAKRYLNAAVNGEWDASLPLEPTDHPNYFTEIRPILRRAAEALADSTREP